MCGCNSYILGFDPGGGGNFGWSICPVVGGQLIPPPQTGLVNHAMHAIQSVQQALPNNANILSAGIDAPLLWTTLGTETSTEYSGAR